MEAISKADLARRLKISKARVSQLCNAGLPTLADGKVDAAAALDWIARRTDPSHRIGRRNRGPVGHVAAPPVDAPVPATPRFSGDAGAVLLVAKAKRAIADAKRAERMERHQAGELFERTEAAAYAANFSGLVRDHVLILPDRLAERLAATNDRAEVYRILRDDGRALLVRLSKAILDADLGKQTEAGR